MESSSAIDGWSISVSTQSRHQDEPKEMENLTQEIAEPEVMPIEAFASNPSSPEPPTSFEWIRNLELLWEERRKLYRAMLIGLMVGVAVALLIPKRYDSTVSIMPPDSLGGSNMMMAALASKGSPELAGMASSLLGTKSSGALFLGLLHSRTVEDRIVDKFNLRKVYGTEFEQDARKILEQRASVEEDRKSGIITLTIRDAEAQRARDMAQSFVEELNGLVSQVSTSSARRERIFIEQRLSSVKSDLENAEQQFSAFASKNTALDIKEQTKAMVESAATLQGQLIAAQSELQGLLQIYNPNNIRVRSAQARVDELKRQLQKIGGTDASSAPDGAQSDDLYPSIRKLPLLGVQWADLYRRVKTQETVYEMLSEQYEMARLQEAKEIPTVNVIDSANLPEKKSWPPRTAIVLFVTLLAFLCSSGSMIGLQHWKNLDQQNPHKRVVAQIARSLNENVRNLRQHRRLNRLAKYFKRKSQ
ncbi:MAG TPA: GNVR domain-containing protein [Terriglobales bacterium]|jgi:capsule polysaccharide export protein KpsE/RkpR